MAASPHYSRHRPRRYGNTAAGFQGPAVPADANVDEQSASPLSSSSAASRTTSWDEHHPPALHSSAEWSVQPCSSSGAADNILSVTPDIDRIRHTLDIRTFQQYSGAIPTSGIHPHMTNSIPEPATFVDGQNHGTHNARLGSFNADSQNPPDSQLSVEMQPSFPGAGPSLNGETTTSTNQSKPLIKPRVIVFRCKPSLDDPNAECQTCRDVQKESKRLFIGSRAFVGRLQTLCFVEQTLVTAALSDSLSDGKVLQYGMLLNGLVKRHALFTLLLEFALRLSPSK
ncbi:unnamed protein product [Parascedosporium putredinis]|uniref:Uncharacterized protein n=1 Tax=Parascedosporium putredinis TaxID=1442378 RepID=A0A9P1GZX2_9PEZI|nr:unnamed protein product [Parascedosporium putredinis]CAI7991238.1 unnamed protein product [Parascedosporium putredinis]